MSRQILEFATEQAWLEARRKYVTSTEVSALFGMNPRITAFELACIKRDPKLDTFEATERTRWGQALQDAIASRVATEHGVVVDGLTLKLAVYDHMAASGDYLIDHLNACGPNGALARYRIEHHCPGMLEIKNVDSLVFRNEWTEGDMPDHIELQLQAEMLCWDVRWGAVAALVGGNRLELYIRERDEEVCAQIAARVNKFMDDLAHDRLPPATMPEDAKMVIALNQYAEPNKVIDYAATAVGLPNSSTLLEMVQTYKSHKRLAAASEEAAESCKANILAMIGDAERVINIPGFNLSASMRADVTIPAHVRKGYRDLRITERKEKKT